MVTNHLYDVVDMHESSFNVNKYEEMATLVINNI
jgi:hypothetical protein